MERLKKYSVILTIAVGEMENVILFLTPHNIAMMEETAKVMKYHHVTH